MTTQTVSPQGKGWGWFPWAIGASLAAIFAINGTLLYFAKTTFPGVAATKPYEVGAAYNRVLANAARQDALGWTLTTRVEGGRLALQLVDHDGKRLDHLSVTGTIVRPVGGDGARALNFSPDVDGVYRSIEPVPAPGQWDLKIAAREGEAVVYKAARRLLAP